MQGSFHAPWQTPGIPFALTPISQLQQSPPSPVLGDQARGKWRDFSPGLKPHSTLSQPESIRVFCENTFFPPNFQIVHDSHFSWVVCVCHLGHFGNLGQINLDFWLKKNLIEPVQIRELMARMATGMHIKGMETGMVTGIGGPWRRAWSRDRQRWMMTDM